MVQPGLDPVLSEATDVARERRRARRIAAHEPPGSLAHEAFTALTGRLESLMAEPDTRETLTYALDRRATAVRTAVIAERYAARAEAALAAAQGIAAGAARTGRSLLAAESARIAQLQAESAARSADRSAWLEARITDVAARDDVLDVLATIRLRVARAQLRRGLLLTQQMRDIISEAVPALTRGEPLLLLGETGGAKTALAEYLSLSELGRDPEFVSGYGDISSTQLIGSHELRSEHGATVSVFLPGPLLRAMTEGRPLILDEVNAMPAEFLKRLNRILQLRPGDEFSVQENGGDRVRIAPGFAVLATANEQTPHRYRGIDRLSAELVNRFGANSYRVHYPDAGLNYTALPAENLLLAAASIADEDGGVPVSSDELERVCRAAFISQQVFSGTHGEGFSTFVSTEREIDGRPGLEESVLAPRTLVAILQKVAGSGGQVSLERALQRFVDGVMHAEDRQVLTLILRSQGFLSAHR